MLRYLNGMKLFISLLLLELEVMYHELVRRPTMVGALHGYKQSDLNARMPDWHPVYRLVAAESGSKCCSQSVSTKAARDRPHRQPRPP